MYDSFPVYKNRNIIGLDELITRVIFILYSAVPCTVINFYMLSILHYYKR